MPASFIRRLLASQRGATAIEYGLIAALLAVIAAGAMSSLGGSVKETYEGVDSAVEAVNTP